MKYLPLDFKPQRAFTLIELLIAIAIVAVLAGISLFTFSGTGAKARDTQRKSDLKQYNASLVQYAAKFQGFYPSYTTAVIPNAAAMCEALYPEENPPCPGPVDPKAGLNECASGSTCNYKYESDGGGSGASNATIWILFAPVEKAFDSTTPWFVICSTGKVGFTAAAGIADSNGVCPI